MQKGCMMKLISVVALLILAPVVEAAAITAEVPDLQQTPLRGNKNPTDPWTSGPDIHDMTTYVDRQEMTVPVRSSGNLDKAISSRYFLDKILAASNSRDRTLNTASVPHEADGIENIVAATSQLSLGSVMDEPEIDNAPMEDSSVQETLIPYSNKQSKSRSAKLNSASSTEDRREKMLHMLSALEELHRSLNNARNSRLTIMTRGNSNSRSPGKKSKMITDGNMKSTTASSAVSKGASLRASTDQVDLKLPNGKAFKKSLPSTPKKTNKRELRNSRTSHSSMTPCSSASKSKGASNGYFNNILNMTYSSDLI